MTDTEKRAHDLAIAMIPIIYDKEYKGTSKSGGNCFEIYKDLYYDLLTDFEYNFQKD